MIQAKRNSYKAESYLASPLGAERIRSGVPPQAAGGGET